MEQAFQRQTTDAEMQEPPIDPGALQHVAAVLSLCEHPEDSIPELPLVTCDWIS